MHQTHTYATDRQPTLHSTSKPQRVKYNQSSLTMLSGHCLRTLTETHRYPLHNDVSGVCVYTPLTTFAQKLCVSNSFYTYVLYVCMQYVCIQVSIYIRFRVCVLTVSIILHNVNALRSKVNILIMCSCLL